MSFWLKSLVILITVWGLSWLSWLFITDNFLWTSTVFLIKFLSTVIYITVNIIYYSKRRK